MEAHSDMVKAFENISKLKRIKDKYLKCCRRFNFSPISSGKFPLKAFRKMNLENPNLEEYVVRGKGEKF